MRLTDGYHAVPAGKLAAVVTSFEMRARPPARPERATAPWALRHVTAPAAAWYRALFVRIGREYLWSARLLPADAELQALLDDPRLAVYALHADGRDDGLLELDFRVPGECELSYVGLAPRLVGTGAGRWLMNRALERAWVAGIERVWVHTCTLDHPAAPAFYLRSGFRAFRRDVEIVDDPRVLGLLPADAAPGVPLLGAPRS